MIIDISRIAFVSAMSGGGKTTAACAIMRAMVKMGLKIAPFKCGPDYIDPMYHFAASGRESANLDLFFSAPDEIRNIFAENTENCDVAVIEGVMGYYDGRAMDSTAASTYEIVRTLGAAAVLILPARGMAYTVIPVIKGLTEFRNDSKIKAVILTGVTGMTYSMLKPVIERETGIAAAGYIPKLENTTESRHLGLTLPWENDREELEKNAETVKQTVDLELLIKIASEVPEICVQRRKFRSGESVKIGVAFDHAFCFYYKDNIDILKQMGAEIVHFSPLSDPCVPDDVSGIILGGGYPELYAGKLSKNTKIMKSIRENIAGGMPCIAECGGFMYLHDHIEDINGENVRMAGVINADAVKKDKLVRFGYADLTAMHDSAYLKKGETIKSHEFHYWDSNDNGNGCLAEKPSRKRSWECVHAKGKLFAGFPHIYLRSNDMFAERFLDECRRFAR